MRVPLKSRALPMASMVNMDDPAGVGVPEMRPSGDRLRPAGSEPLVSSHVVLDGGPATSSLAEYGAPRTAGFSCCVVIVNRRAQTSNVKSVSALLLSQSRRWIQALQVP